MPILLLVDASSYLYRAFHGLPDLRNSRGEPTAVLHGVLSMLRRLEGLYPAQYRACVFDAKGKTFRDDWYPEYKANRPPMPDELRVQIEPLHAAIRAAGWPLLCIEGVEADDVIGTLARQGEAEGMEVLVVTGDKDLTQLVSPQVRWVNTMSRGDAEVEVLDVAGVEAKFGVPPSGIVDYLALVGDKVDNVPGVDKCGAKTALKWLEEYGSLDGVIQHAAQIKGKVGENLRAHLDFLPLGRRLVTVATELPLELSLAELATRAPDRAALAELYAHHELRTLLRELQAEDRRSAAGSARASTGKNADDDGSLASASTAAADTGAHRAGYVLIQEPAQLDEWLSRLLAAERVALDTETTSLDPLAAQLVGISFALAEGEAAYLPLAHCYAGAPPQLDRAATLETLRPWLESAAQRKLGQNLKYDAHVFANHGIALAGIEDDTLLQSAVLESDRPHDLDSMTRRHLGLEPLTYTELCGKGAKQIGFEEVEVERAAAYAAEDADLTLRLYQRFAPRIGAEPGLQRVYREIEMPALPVLFAMERTGVLIDPFLLAAQGEELGRRLAALEERAYQLAGQRFNLGSPKQLGEILFVQLGHPVKKKTATGQPSTDEDVLQQLAEDYPLPALLLEHRSLAKLKSTYADKLPRMVNPRTGRVHTHFAQAGAVTGRLSSSEPNLQNIPIRTEEGRRIRAAFIAPAGHVIVSADYSQIELRIMAHLSGDARLLQAFAQGEDVHRATAAEIFGLAPDAVSSEQRRYAKVINFGLIYGMGTFGLAKNLGLERGAAQQYIDRYFARYPGVANYMERIKTEARERGYVETVFGRRLILPDLRANQATRRQAAERAAINAPMQGSAADLIKLSMVATHHWLQAEGLRSRLVLQVHDELVLEVPQDELERVRAELPRIMGGVAELAVPLLVEVGHGDNWDQAH